MDSSRRLSLRWRLSATYAMLALLTAVLIGGLLTALLNRHFAQIDTDRLHSTAQRAAFTVAAAPPSDLSRSLMSTAYTMNARIQALDAAGVVIADSGPPASIPASSVGNPAGVNAPSDKEIRTSASVSVAAFPGSPPGVATLRATDGPASGAGLVDVVLVAWAIAAGASVVVAAGVGYVVSDRIVRPVGRLATASDQMAAGDLTARADVERGDELGQLAESFNRMAARLATDAQARERFVSDAAHQLGTPLTALRTDLELIRDDGGSNDDVRRRAERALTQEQRLAELSTSLLRLSRLEASDGAAETQLLEINALVSSAVDAVASRADQADIDLTVELSPNPITVAAVPARILDVVGNLLDNALKFTPAGGAIRVSVVADAGRAMVSVSDTGPGIPPQERELVFDRFYRSRETANVAGNGLGLAIAQRSAQTFGGVVSVLPSDVGACVAVVIPTASPPRA